MINIISASCKRCLQSANYRGIIKDHYKRSIANFAVLQARTNFRKTESKNILPQDDKEEILKEIATNATCTSAKYTSKNEDQDLVENQASEDSDDVPTPPYVKLQDEDTIISKAMIAVNSKTNKINRKEILLEGTRLISEAIKHRISPKQVFFSRLEDVKKISWPANEFNMYKVSYRTIKLWSSVSTSPGVVGIFEAPDMEAKETNENAIPLIIVCDNVRDPGNLGSVLRIAAGVGCQYVLLTKGCVDLWDPKVLRSGAGAHFVLPVHRNCTWEKIEKYMDYDSPVILADSHSSSSVEIRNPLETSFQDQLPLHQYHLVDYSTAWETNSPILLILGGETEGLSKEACILAESRGGIRLHIPLQNDVESLNTATALGVITFEIRRQYQEWTKKNEQSSLMAKNSIEAG